MRTRFLLAAVAVLAVATGCTGEEGSGQSSSAVGRAPNTAPAEKQAAPQATVPIAGQDRRLARTAQLALTASDVGAVAGQARQIAAAAGGYSGSERTGSGSATMSLFVPGDQLDAVIGRLAELGQVMSSQQNAEDVTDQVVDVESRLATARRSVERVRVLLDRATSISDITSIESQLTSRESELESLQARQNTLAGRVAMSTVSLTVTAAVAPPAVAADSGFLPGLDTGWHGFLGFGEGVLHVLGVVLPFAAILGVPAFALFWFARRRRWFKARA